mmetsp:Transcript_32765/g.104440  ORF Transcript_32765/g.104440 Transcript_32765/m.104440 type:complete len:129 (+) Transcript_32765:46-432(+)
MEEASASESGCISLLDSRWYRCLDVTCSDDPGNTAESSAQAPATEQVTAESFLQRAEDEERKGNYRAASECYRRAVRLDPTNAQLHNNFGYLCSTHTHDYSTAEYHYRLPDKWDPNYAFAYNNLGFFF